MGLFYPQTGDGAIVYFCDRHRMTAGFQMDTKWTTRHFGSGLAFR
jgi:hypothetical protein